MSGFDELLANDQKLVLAQLDSILLVLIPQSTYCMVCCQESEVSRLEVALSLISRGCLNLVDGQDNQDDFDELINVLAHGDQIVNKPTSLTFI